MKYEIRKYIGTTDAYELIENVALPLSITEKLNEEFDTAVVNIVDVSYSRRIPKNTRITIIDVASEDGKYWDFVVSMDIVTRTRASEELYNHELQLVESTSLLNNTQLPNVSFTRTDTSSLIEIYTEEDFWNIGNDAFSTYVLKNDITLNKDKSRLALNTFYGSLYGLGHTITLNWSGSNNSYYYQGLFSINSGNIYDLSININYTAGNFASYKKTAKSDGYMSLFVGHNIGSIENVRVTANVADMNVRNRWYDNAYYAPGSTTGIGTKTSGNLYFGFFCAKNDGYITNSSLSSSDGTSQRFTILTPEERYSYKYNSFNGFAFFVGSNSGVIDNSVLTNIRCVIGYSLTSVYDQYDTFGVFTTQNSSGTVSNCYVFSDSSNSPYYFNGTYSTQVFGSSNYIKNCYVVQSHSNGLNSGTYTKRLTLAEGKVQDNFSGFNFYTIWVMDNYPQLQERVIYDIANVSTSISIQYILTRLLNIAKVRRNGIEQEYEISSGLYSYLLNTRATNTSEFFFNGLNLFECLLEIGGKINAIPYLEDFKYINFLFLNQNQETWEAPKNCNYFNYQNAEEYATKLVSFNENQVNAESTYSGSTIYPFDGGWVTPRAVASETSVVSSDSACLVLENLPIYNLLKLEVTNIDGDKDTVYDITNYVYEAQQYNALPATSTGAGTQGYALKFDQYDNVIYGFSNQTIKGFTPVATTMTNIIKAVSGKTITTFTGLWFRVTVVPAFKNCDVTEKKKIVDFEFNQDLAINQPTSNVSTDNYGTYKQYKMNKMANIEEGLDFTFDSLESMPNVGDVLSNSTYTVNEITSNLYENVTYSTIKFTKDFNRISEFISIDSRKRAFSIPTTDIQDRYVNYGEYIKVTENEQPIYEDNLSVISTLALQETFAPFTGIQSGNTAKCSCVAVHTFDSAKSIISSSLLPVNAYSTPTSLCFAYSMKDNISAGAYAVVEQEDTTNQYLMQQYLYARNGRVQYVVPQLMTRFTTSDTGYVRELPKLPEANFTIANRCIMNFGEYGESDVYSTTNALIIDKDLRETYNQTLQIHYYSKENDLFFRDKLLLNNPLTKTEFYANDYSIYFLDRELGEYENIVPTDAVETDLKLGSIEREYYDNRVVGCYFLVLDQNGDMVEEISGIGSWFIADNVTGDIFIGKNGSMNKGQSIRAYSQRLRDEEYFIAEEEVQEATPAVSISYDVAQVDYEDGLEFSSDSIKLTSSESDDSAIGISSASSNVINPFINGLKYTYNIDPIFETNAIIDIYQDNVTEIEITNTNESGYLSNITGISFNNIPNTTSITIRDNKDNQRINIEELSITNGFTLNELNLYYLPRLKTLSVAYCFGLKELNVYDMPSFETLNMFNTGNINQLTIYGSFDNGSQFNEILGNESDFRNMYFIDLSYTEFSKDSTKVIELVNKLPMADTLELPFWLTAPQLSITGADYNKEIEDLLTAKGWVLGK